MLIIIFFGNQMVHSSFYDLHMMNTNTDVVYQELHNLIEGFPSGILVSRLHHLEAVYIMRFQRSPDYNALGVSTIEDILRNMDDKSVMWLKKRESGEEYVISARIIETRRKLYLKNDVQELLMRHGGAIEFNSFEDSYMDHFKEKLAYDYYGLARGLEELCEILEDIMVQEEGTKQSVIK